ncbi:MAG: XdhC/CoxI family protein [Candidatus Omnitrophota bacterium]
MESNKKCVLAMVVACSGSSPAVVGGRMVVSGEGRIAGTVGGGGLEKLAIADAVSALKRGKSFLKEYPLDRKSGLQVCGGKVSIFFDVISPPKHLVIAGAGHIGLSLSVIAKLLDYDVTVVDNRREFADPKRFPHIGKVLCGRYEKILRKIPMDRHTAVVIVTHGHLHDAEALRTVLSREAGYIGMIGSRAKIEHVFKEMKRLGFTANRLKSVHTPIGLDIGAQTPEEIAVAIAAELIQMSKMEG